jgi:hypothetical protein
MLGKSDRIQVCQPTVSTEAKDREIQLSTSNYFRLQWTKS